MTMPNLIGGAGAVPGFGLQISNPAVPGLQIGSQLTCADSTGQMFAPATGGFQPGAELLWPARREIRNAAQEAHTGLLTQVAQHLGQAGETGEAGALRLIDKAEAKALDAVLRHAADPGAVREIYAAGRYAARAGVVDLAVALSELRANGGAPADCERLEKELCELTIADRLGEHSGFAAWHGGNSYRKVEELAAKVNSLMEALPGGPDIFKSVMQREVMPAIRQFLQTKFGTLSNETWEKIDAAAGLISHAAAEAADRMTDSMRACERGDGSGALHARVNQWRVAQHWAELMRPVERPDDRDKQPPAPPAAPESPAAAPHSPPPSPQSAWRQPAAPAAAPVTQIASPTINVTPIIVNGRSDMFDFPRWQPRTTDPLTTDTPMRVMSQDGGRAGTNGPAISAGGNAVPVSDPRATIGPDPGMAPAETDSVNIEKRARDENVRFPYGNSVVQRQRHTKPLRIDMPPPPPPPLLSLAQPVQNDGTKNSGRKNKEPLSPVQIMIRQFEAASVGAAGLPRHRSLSRSASGISNSGNSTGSLSPDGSVATSGRTFQVGPASYRRSGRNDR